MARRTAGGDDRARRVISATGYRWQALDARSWRPGPVHVREDLAGDKRVWWVDEAGQPGIGEHRLEDLVYADRLPLARRVVVTEGEKAADAVRAAGIDAVGTVCGASSTPGQAVVDLFLGVAVILWPDADAVGRDHMGRFARLLEPIVASMGRIVWPDAPEHGDAADLTPERIRELVGSAHDVWLRR